MLTIGSLFSGVGLLERGLEDAGLGPVLYQCEADEFCRRVLAVFYPSATRFRDVRTLSAKHVPYVDILCGGFPCQDASVAGKGAGIDGERTGLWREYIRLVRELADEGRPPRFIVAENVPGLIRRGLDRVVADLAAAGYAVEATRIRASDVGAPHRRERLFIIGRRVAHTDGDRVRVEQQRQPARQPGCLCDSGQALALDGGEALADGDTRQPGDEGACGHEPDGRGSAELADATSGGLGERGQPPRADRQPDSGDEAMAHADGVGHRSGLGHVQARQPDAQRRGEGLGDTDGARREGPGLQRYEHAQSGYVWPPGPDDVHAWRDVPAHAQPGICRLAHGGGPLVGYRRALLAALGNAVIRQCAEVVGRRVMDHERTMCDGAPR